MSETIAGAVVVGVSCVSGYADDGISQCYGIFQLNVPFHRYLRRLIDTATELNKSFDTQMQLSMPEYSLFVATGGLHEDVEEAVDNEGSVAAASVTIFDNDALQLDSSELYVSDSGIYWGFTPKHGSSHWETLIISSEQLDLLLLPSQIVVAHVRGER